LRGIENLLKGKNFLVAGAGFELTISRGAGLLLTRQAISINMYLP
jgi:hypothetical protein